MFTSDTLFHSELLQNVPDWYFDEFQQKLKHDPQYQANKDDFIIDEKEKTILHLFVKFNRSEVVGLTDQQIEFYPLCNLEEIELLSNPTDAEDYLLKLRAEEVNNHMRTTRVFYRLRKFYGEQWNFTNYFHSKLFRQYTFLLSPELEFVCDEVPAGFINYPEVNGCCTKTVYGNIILISFALKYFLYYGTIWAIADHLGVNEDDAFAALIIAIRTMMGYESMDFEIDPRADLPEEMHQQVQQLTDRQLQFIMGHEYAHHYLGHLDDKKLVDLSAFTAVEGPVGNLKIYNYSQQNELDADFYAIQSLDGPDDDDIKGAFLAASTTFFCILDIYRCFKDAMDPHVGNYRSHPDPVDRILELRKKFPETIGYTSEDIAHLLDRNKKLKAFLLDGFISTHTDEIEMYGSYYVPSYKNQKPFDRLDF